MVPGPCIDDWYDGEEITEAANDDNDDDIDDRSNFYGILLYGIWLAMISVQL